ncbi:carboxylating nicotinate-nucleotide diphosphorylase [Bacillus tianshenii]|nr:carboxylating nicotinate-nucleotide diphosphorylase [Bacillus tianshenii]
MNQLKLKQKMQEFFIEDIGDGDATNEHLFQSTDITEGEFLLKQDGVLAGISCIEAGYKLLNPNIEVETLQKDGEFLQKGAVLAKVKGPVKDLLTGERVILNLLQHMSGIATTTKQAVNALDSTHTRVCDTRKTLPGLRMFEKYAVTCGGGYNHRVGLYDGVMLKDNHIAYAGSITNAVQMIRSRIGHMIKIEVETESMEQVLKAVEAGADVIMFDNCTPQQAQEYATVVPKPIITEISGGITPYNIASYRETNVDYISLGYLTQSARALDISFNLKESIKYNHNAVVCETINNK